MVCASGWACDNDMRAVRALPKRVARIERAAMPQASPFALLYGSFGQFVEREVPPGIQAGALDRADMVDVVGALRPREQDGTWNRATVGGDRAPPANIDTLIAKR